MAAPEQLRFWRVFPWDENAAAGEPFSASYVPLRQGSGRFDLGGASSVLYLGESEAHAIGEKFQRYRGQEIAGSELREFGRPLATVQIQLELKETHLLPDLCDPRELQRYKVRPDELMSRGLTRTQSISRHLYDQNRIGFRCWSAISGDWHSVVLFLDRIANHARLRFGTPREIQLDTPALIEAAAILAITIV